MDSQSAPELRLEPGSLGRHDVACIGYPDELLHGYWIQGEGRCHLSGINSLLELAESADTTYEVNALRGTEILDVEELVEDKVGADGHVEASDGIVVVVGARACRSRYPCP